MRLYGLRPADAVWEQEVWKLTASIKQLKEKTGIAVLGED